MDAFALPLMHHHASASEPSNTPCQILLENLASCMLACFPLKLLS